MREATLLVGLRATGTSYLAEQSRGPESEFLDLLADISRRLESPITIPLRNAEFHVAPHIGWARLLASAQGQQRPDVVDEYEGNRDPEHHVGQPLQSSSGMIKPHNNGKPHDARCCEHRGIRPCNQVFQAFH